MTDDLVARLLDWPYQGETMAHEAADSIKQLVATNKQLTAERDRLRESLMAICDATPRFDYVRIVPGSDSLAEPGSPFDRGKAEGFILLQDFARAALKGESYE